MCIFSSARFGEEKRGVNEGQNRPYLVRLISVFCPALYIIGNWEFESKKTDSAKLGHFGRRRAI